MNMGNLTHHQIQARRMMYQQSSTTLATLAKVAAAHLRLGVAETAFRLGKSRDCVSRMVALHIELERGAQELAKASVAGEELDEGIVKGVLDAVAHVSPVEVAGAAARLGALDEPAPSNPDPVGPVPGGSATIRGKKKR